MGSPLGLGAEEVLSAQHRTAERALDGVGGEGDPWIFQKDGEVVPPILQLVKRFGQRTAFESLDACSHRSDVIDERFGVLVPEAGADSQGLVPRKIRRHDIGFGFDSKHRAHLVQEYVLAVPRRDDLIDLA